MYTNIKFRENLPTQIKILTANAKEIEDTLKHVEALILEIKTVLEAKGHYHE